MEVLFEQTYTIGQIEAVAQSLLPHIKEQPNLLFKGEVGAGKTTMIKALVALLGIDAAVTSPTFGLVNDYESNEICVHHFDLYRLDNVNQLLNIGWEEYLESGHWLWVEWPENVPEAFDDSFQLLEIVKGAKEDTRHLSLKR